MGKVIYSTLGVLLVAQRPLSQRCIRNILSIEDYRLEDYRLKKGITKSSGLLTEDDQQHYSLFHNVSYHSMVYLPNSYI